MASVPNLLERWMRVAIGVSLGPAVASSISLNADDLPFAVSSAVLVTMVTALSGMAWFRARTNLSRSSAFLSALPGGLSVFLALADDRGNRAQILLAHTIRVVIVVVFISLLARVLGVTDSAESAVHSGTQLQALFANLHWRGGANPVVLLVLVALSFFVAERVKLAGSHVIVPMLLTAVIATVSPLSVESPVVIQSIAMLVFGIVLGQQIGQSVAADNWRLVRAASVFSGFAILLVAIIALVLSKFIPQGFLVLFLALAPGGIAEVSLVALALGLDAGLVALVHSCRFLFIVFIGPLALRYFHNDGRSH